MRKKILSALLLLAAGINAQQTIILKPNATLAKDAYIRDLSPDLNMGYHPDFNAMAWTYYGEPVTVRSLIQFDYSIIPEGSKILNAKLSLYNNPLSYNNSGNHSSQSGSNEAYLCKILSDWNEETVTWNNQPSTTTEGQVTLPQSTDTHQNYLDIDVTKLVQADFVDLSKSYGYMLKLATEDYYRTLVFASSDNRDTTLHPKLEISYIAPTQIIIQSDTKDGKDAYIRDLSPDLNMGNHPDFNAMAWTYYGEPVTVRSLIDFDFSKIPIGAEVQSAYLTLYNNPNSLNNSGLHDGDNIAYLRRITSNWDEYTVTWNNQPTTTNLNELILPVSTSSNQNYTDIDVTQLVLDIISNPETSNGLMLSLQTENYYRSLVFASSDNEDCTKHPKLVININPAIITENNNTNQQKTDLKIYPNPAINDAILYFSNTNESEYSINIYDIQGTLVNHLSGSNSDKIIIPRKNLKAGVYFIQIQHPKGRISTQKLIFK